MYTDEELEAAVLAFLTTSATPTRTEAGTRDVVAAREQVYEMVAATFMLRPDSFFSVCWMASNALRALVATQLDTLRQILESAPRAAGSSPKIETTAELRSAEAALVTLSGALASRSRGFVSGVGPTVQRFNASLEAFLQNRLAPRVVVEGQIVDTPEAVRTHLQSAWAEARPRHTEILSRAQALLGAHAEFDKAQLPDVVVASVLERAKGRMDALAATLEGPGASVAARGALLELLAMRALLNAAASFRAPAPVRAKGTAGVWTAQGVPAQVVGAACAPFLYPQGVALRLSVGGVPQSVVLPRPTEGQATLDEVLRALAQAGHVRATPRRTRVPPAGGLRDGQRPRVLLQQQAQGADLVGDGVGGAACGADLAALGVVPGMVLVVGGALYVIRAVSGGNLATAPAVPAGPPAPYVVGQDYRALPGGAVVTVSGTWGSLDCRLVRGGAAELEVDQDVAPGQLRFGVLAEQLVLAAPDAGGALEVLASEGAEVLGLAVGVAQPGRAGFDTKLQLSAVGVVPGDRLAASGRRATIASVSGAVVQLAAPIEGLDGTGGPFTIFNGFMEDLGVLQAALDAVVRDDVFGRADAIDGEMARLGRGARFNGELQARVTQYVSALLVLQAALDAYEVPRDLGVEMIVRVLREQGFDRALDLFLGLRFAEFFGLEADGVSYKTWLVRSAATAVREVAPVTKAAYSTASTWRTLAVRTNPYEP